MKTALRQKQPSSKTTKHISVQFSSNKHTLTVTQATISDLSSPNSTTLIGCGLAGQQKVIQRAIMTQSWCLDYS